MAYFRKLGPTDKNYERSHILSKVFFFFSLLCIFLGAVYMGQGSSFSLLPHCYQCSPTQTPLPTDLCIWCISDMVSVKTTREPGEAKTFKYNNNNTYCVQRLCLFFLSPLNKPSPLSCGVWQIGTHQMLTNPFPKSYSPVFIPSREWYIICPVVWLLFSASILLKVA